MRHGILAAARGKDGLVHSIFCALKTPLDSGLSRLRRVFGALNERRNKPIRSGVDVEHDRQKQENLSNTIDKVQRE